MKAQRSSSKSGLFLIELIIAITFFSVSSAICIQLFVKSHTISSRSTDIGTASMLAQNYAEQYKSIGYDEKMVLFYGEDATYIENYYYGYDKAGRVTLLEPDQEKDAAYLLYVAHEDNFSPTLSARIHVFKYTGSYPHSDDAPIFSLDVKSYGLGE